MPKTRLGSSDRNGKRAKRTTADREQQHPRTEEEIRKVLDDYFTDCDSVGELYSEAGIALALDVPLETLADWWEGKGPEGYTWPVKRAYLRLQHQIETHPAYREKGGMATRGIFAMKQKRLGGWVDRIESRADINVNVKMGGGMDESDFK